MAYPSIPEIQTNYTAIAQAQGDGSFPGQQLDVDLANLRDAIENWTGFVKRIQRSDGKLGNLTVNQDQLGPEIRLGIAAPEVWATATAYRSPDTVFHDTGFYLCVATHTSATFADDLASGYWVELVNFQDAIDTSISSLNVVPRASSISALKAETQVTGKTVLLTDDIRSGAWYWDPTVTIAQHQADAEFESVYAAPNSAADGAWVHFYGDPRRGNYSNSTPPARPLRVSSKVLIGDAATWYGATTGNNGTTDTWLADVGDFYGNGLTLGYTQHASLFVARGNGGIAATFACRNPNTSNAYALMAIAIGAGSDEQDVAMGAYIESTCEIGHQGNGIGIELEVCNLSRATLPNNGGTPYAPVLRGLYSGLNIGVGSDQSVHGDSYDVDAFIRFGNNGGFAKTGITMRHNALRREGSSVSGHARAIQLAQGYGIYWFGPDDGAENFRFYAQMSDATTATQLYVTNGVLRYGTLASSSNTFFSVPYVASAVNGHQLTPSIAGSPVVHTAVGTDTDIDIRITPKGNGKFALSYAAPLGTDTFDRLLEIKLGTTPYIIPCKIKP